MPLCKLLDGPHHLKSSTHTIRNNLSSGYHKQGDQSSMYINPQAYKWSLHLNSQAVPESGWPYKAFTRRAAGRLYCFFFQSSGQASNGNTNQVGGPQPKWVVLSSRTECKPVPHQPVGHHCRGNSCKHQLPDWLRALRGLIQGPGRSP